MATAGAIVGCVALKACCGALIASFCTLIAGLIIPGIFALYCRNLVFLHYNLLQLLWFFYTINLCLWSIFIKIYQHKFFSVFFSIICSICISPSSYELSFSLISSIDLPVWSCHINKIILMDIPFLLFCGNKQYILLNIQ